MAHIILENHLAELGYSLEEAPAKVIEKARKTLIERGFDPDAIDEGSENFTCSICGKFFEKETSSSAKPINSGRCCFLCSTRVVSPIIGEIIKRTNNFEMTRKAVNFVMEVNELIEAATKK